ncbi:NADPH azoreductase [Pigmentiphaga humi]|uniref:NADPH azoreductase n=1 Tax=Pigmentiphaga humi TaxID=2478468 RepID=A0A3P4AX45_9BURK|nr:NAD(P)H-dependent oxidoreductase [Pigmentiphaga humi]VCU68629.1 NADPH azoreductase [Pigmentiphaga humi]
MNDLSFGQGRPPVILGIGGTLRPYSSSELALRLALEEARRLGAETELLVAADLGLPMYDPAQAHHVEAANQLLEAVRRADCVIFATPGYHGGISGFLKNALDYLQGLADDPDPYLHNKAVGCIVSAAGWQAGATVLASVRATIHALRGWPTPLGVAINSAQAPFGADGKVADAKVGEQLAALAGQVVTFARARVGVHL